MDASDTPDGSRPRPAASSSPSPSPSYTRAALRLIVSAQEYRLIHDRLLSRAPSSVLDHVPSPARFGALVHAKSKDKPLEAALRVSLRVFALSSAALRLVDLVKKPSKSNRATNARLSLSLSLVLFLHRLLYRFLVKLRANLRADEARPFRERNPRVTRALTARSAPAVGASLAGLALVLCPQRDLRRTLAIYTGSRAAEFFYNVADEQGWLGTRPQWVGSWLLMPLACAQLFHALVFDRETTPKWLPALTLRLSPSYIHPRPEGYPVELPWPDQEGVLDSLATIAELKWPDFVSPILHPSTTQTLPAAVQSISPLTGSAHPSLASLSCALLHPALPSCSTAFLHHLLLTGPRLVRLLAVAAALVTVPRVLIKSLALPFPTSVPKLAQRVLAFAATLSTTTGLAWASLCLWTSLLPRSSLATKRFFLSGALAGLPLGLFFRGSSYCRGMAMYLVRAALDSAWRVRDKHHHNKQLQSPSRASSRTRGLPGDVALVVAAWAVIGVILDTYPAAVRGSSLRKALVWMRGDGFKDPVKDKKDKRDKKKALGSN
ncbi:hypothetical protein ASPZODRAFT_16407 [Penicilliopsis zonata CBS 506.65]|uniref:Transmembrane protein 135 N-terminal domain-containing protein n=1 Tax=Penicilliopsis zonata CBS 506.65 TaxID=1073090 RepID=A0A1L9SHF3_9EURO|nr:hypothetical protein ASPZODRAFT_16407 [Penicilliopsis zonata CBS 506.65]OJJ46652.1 hypothetical protein ASPZODRAFT_16407 [Penicilliopsis zonata CBS 506.65]